MFLTTSEVELLTELAKRDRGSALPVVGRDREFATVTLINSGLVSSWRANGQLYVEITVEGVEAMERRKDRAERLKDVPDSAHALLFENAKGIDRLVRAIQTPTPLSAAEENTFIIDEPDAPAKTIVAMSLSAAMELFGEPDDLIEHDSNGQA